MSTATVVLEDNETTHEDELYHLTCPCSRYITLCGIKLTDSDTEYPYAEDLTDCVVCVDLDRVGCPRCGR